MKYYLILLIALCFNASFIVGQINQACPTIQLTNLDAIVVPITTQYGCITLDLTSKTTKQVITTTITTGNADIFYGAPQIPHDQSQDLINPKSTNCVYSQHGILVDSKEKIVIGFSTPAAAAQITVKVVLVAQTTPLVCSGTKRMIEGTNYATCLDLNDIPVTAKTETFGDVYVAKDVVLKTNSYNRINLDSITTKSLPGAFYVVSSTELKTSSSNFYIATSCSNGKTYIEFPSSATNSWTFTPKTSSVFYQSADKTTACKFALASIFDGIQTSTSSTYKVTFAFYVNQKFEEDFHILGKTISLDTWWNDNKYYPRYTELDLQTQVLESTDNVKSLTINVKPEKIQQIYAINYGGDQETVCKSQYPAVGNSCKATKNADNTFSFSVSPTNTKVYTNFQVKPVTGATAFTFTSDFDIVCNDFYKYSKIEKVCKQQISNCKAYTDAKGQTCKTCKTGYHLLENGKLCIKDAVPPQAITTTTASLTLSEDLNYFKVDINNSNFGQIVEILMENNPGATLTFYVISDYLCKTEGKVVTNATFPSSSNNCKVYNNVFKYPIREYLQGKKIVSDTLYFTVEVADFMNSPIKLKYTRAAPKQISATGKVTFTNTFKADPSYFEIKIPGNNIQTINVKPITACLLHQTIYFGSVKYPELKANYFFPDHDHSAVSFAKTDSSEVYFADDTLRVTVPTNGVACQKEDTIEVQVTFSAAPATIPECTHGYPYQKANSYITCFAQTVVPLTIQQGKSKQYIDQVVTAKAGIPTVFSAQIQYNDGDTLIPGAFYVTYNTANVKPTYISSDCIMKTTTTPYTFYDNPQVGTAATPKYNVALTQAGQVASQISTRIFTTAWHNCQFAAGVNLLGQAQDVQLRIQFYPFQPFSYTQTFTANIPWSTNSAYRVYQYNFENYSGLDSVDILINNEKQNVLRHVYYSYPEETTGDCSGIIPTFTAGTCDFTQTPVATLNNYKLTLQAAAIAKKKINIYVETQQIAGSIVNPYEFKIQTNVKCSNSDYFFSPILKQCISPVSNCQTLQADNKKLCSACIDGYSLWNNKAACIPTNAVSVTEEVTAEINGQYSFFHIDPKQYRKNAILYINMQQNADVTIQAEYYISCNALFPSKDNNCGAFVPTAHEGMYLKIDENSTDDILFSVIIQGAYTKQNNNGIQLTLNIHEEDIQVFHENTADIELPITVKTEPLFFLIDASAFTSFQEITVKSTDSEILAQHITFTSAQLIPKNENIYSVMTSLKDGQTLVAKSAKIMVKLQPEYTATKPKLTLTFTKYTATSYSCAPSLKVIDTAQYKTCITPIVKVLPAKVFVDKVTLEREYYFANADALIAEKNKYTIFTIKNFDIQGGNEFNRITKGIFYLVNKDKTYTDKIIISTNANPSCAVNYAQIPDKTNECATLIKKKNEIQYGNIDLNTVQETYVQFAIDLLDLTITQDAKLFIYAYPQFIVTERFLDEKMNLTTITPWDGLVTAPIYYKFDIDSKFPDADNIQDIVIHVLDSNYHTDNKLYAGVNNDNSNCQYAFPKEGSTCSVTSAGSSFRLSLASTLASTTTSVTDINEIILSYEVVGTTKPNNIQINYDVQCKDAKKYYNQQTYQCEDRIIHCTAYNADYSKCSACLAGYSLNDDSTKCIPSTLTPKDISTATTTDVDLEENFFSIKMQNLQDYDIFYANLNEDLQADYYIQCPTQTSLPDRYNNCGYFTSSTSNGLMQTISDDFLATWAGKPFNFLVYIYNQKPDLPSNSLIKLQLFKQLRPEYTTSGTYRLNVPVKGEPVYFQIAVNAAKIQDISVKSNNLQVLKSNNMYFSSNSIPKTTTQFPTITDRINTWYTVDSEGKINGQRLNLKAGKIYVALYPAATTTAVSFDIVITDLTTQATDLYCSELTQVKIVKDTYIACINAEIQTLQPQVYGTGQDFWNQQITAKRLEYNVFRMVPYNIEEFPENNAVPAALYLVNLDKKVKGQNIYIQTNCSSQCTLSGPQEFVIPTNDFNCWSAKKADTDIQTTVLTKKLDSILGDSLNTFECTITIAIDLLETTETSDIDYQLILDPFFKLQDEYHPTSGRPIEPTIAWGATEVSTLYYELDLQVPLASTDNVAHIDTTIEVKKALQAQESIYLLDNVVDPAHPGIRIFPDSTHKVDPTSSTTSKFVYQTAPTYDKLYLAYSRFGRSDNSDFTFYVTYDVTCAATYVYNNYLKSCVKPDVVVDNCIEYYEPGTCQKCVDSFQLSASGTICASLTDITQSPKVYDPTNQNYWVSKTTYTTNLVAAKQLKLTKNDLQGVLYIESTAGFTNTPIYINTDCLQTATGIAYKGIPDSKTNWQTYNGANDLLIYEINSSENECSIWISYDQTKALTTINTIYLPTIKAVEHLKSDKYNIFVPWETQNAAPFYFELDLTASIKSMKNVQSLTIQISEVNGLIMKGFYLGTDNDNVVTPCPYVFPSQDRTCRVQAESYENVNYYKFHISNEDSKVYLSFSIEKSGDVTQSNFNIETTVVCVDDHEHPYYWKPETQTCELKPECEVPHCYLCTTTDKTKCDTCDGTAYQLENNKCYDKRELIENCHKYVDSATYTDKLQCADCLVGFKLSSDKNYCEPICLIANCKYCYDAYHCQECQDNFQISENHQQCLAEPCEISNCNVCKDAKTCKTCNTGFTISADGTTCDTHKCNAGYFFDNQYLECIQCTFNCVSCKDQFHCDKCQDNYQLIQTTDGKNVCKVNIASKIIISLITMMVLFFSFF